MNNLLLLKATPFNCSQIAPVLGVAKFVLTVIQYVVPVLLILWGTIDLVKAVIAGKEDDIKKNQKVLVKRLIAAIIVFLVPIIVNVVMGLIGNTGSGTWTTCWDDAKAEIPNINDKK